ncbi:pyrroloquinoline quinone precursor peptide PqqA [Aromatoleum toluclasticum]|nr:pyrroloquinoline quinone precursor peptide PqqA [Aromatoleum toluclasticum]
MKFPTFWIRHGREVEHPVLRPGNNAAVASPNLDQRHRRHIMKWETPSACDFRFGFEITMYIATR